MKPNDSRTVRVLVGAVALTVGLSSSASSQDLSKLPALAPALAELRSELSLTDAQSAEATKILVELLSGAKGAVDRFGGLDFDSLLDLLVEARSMRQEYVPRLTGLLTEEQKGKLAKLPKNHGIYTSAMAGWLAEAQLGKLKERAGLTDEQLPKLRAVLLGQFQEVVAIAEGLVRREDGESMKDEILGAVLVLRGIQRKGRRDVDALLTADQRVRIEALRKESEKSS